MPLVTVFSILRYRLFDVDVLIRRGLVYGLLTLALGLIFVGSVFVLQAAFRTLTGANSEISIVLSTMLSTALALPLRNRIQAAIDRRFYRSKYGAQKSLEALATRLREATDLDALVMDVKGVVQETLQPEHVTLWLADESVQDKKCDHQSYQNKTKRGMSLQ